MNVILSPEGISYYLLQAEDPLYENILQAENLPRGNINTVKGILYLFKYLRTENNRDANQAHQYLLKASGTFSLTPLFKSLLGMSYAMQAKIKTIFGLDDLNKMRVILKEIPEDPVHWQTRFFRAKAAYNVGMALPDIFFIAEAKHEAIEMGLKDLQFLLHASECGTMNIPVEVINTVKKSLDKSNTP